MRRGADSNRAPSERAEVFVLLASKSWECSFKITSSAETKDATAIAKAKACVTDGFGFSNQALTLDPESESAWAYKTNLLLEASKIAGLEGRASEKVSYLTQYDEALKRRSGGNNGAASSADHFTITEIIKELGLVKEEEDLLEFKAANSLDEVASDLLPYPLEVTLVSDPTNSGSDRVGTLSSKSAALAQQKRDWKTLTVAEDLSLDLPDNASKTGNSYHAGSDGVVYSVVSTDRNPFQAGPTVGDGTMNVIARTYIGFISRAWLEGGYGNTFELKFLRKEISKGQPRKVYSYSVRSCSKSKEGVLLVQTSQSHFHTIDISGATDSSASVQRLLSSIKVK